MKPNRLEFMSEDDYVAAEFIAMLQRWQVIEPMSLKMLGWGPDDD